MSEWLPWIPWSVAAVALMLLPQPTPLRGGGRRPARPSHRFSPAERRALVVAVGVTALVWLLAPDWGLAGTALSALCWLLLRRFEPPPSAAERLAAQEDLAAICRLWAACLDAGMPVGSALAAVLGVGPAARAPESAAQGDPPVPDPVDAPGSGARSMSATRARSLGNVAALLDLGATPEAAWNAVADDPDLTPLASAAVRSAAGGARMADAVRDQAVRLRESIRGGREGRAGRAGVLIAAPLGLCFLPAFICIGLVPVVIGLFGSLDIGS